MAWGNTEQGNIALIFYISPLRKIIIVHLVFFSEIYDLRLHNKKPRLLGRGQG